MQSEIFSILFSTALQVDDSFKLYFQIYFYNRDKLHIRKIQFDENELFLSVPPLEEVE